MNPLTKGIEEKARKFVTKVGWLSDDEAVGAMLEMFALGLAAGGSFKESGALLPAVENIHGRAMELTEDKRYFADERFGAPPKKKRKRST